MGGGEVHKFEGQKCTLAVDEEFTITGLQDGGDEAPSLIEVNEEHIVSLEASAIGKVLHIDYEGLRVPGRFEVRVSALLGVVTSQSRQRAWRQHEGFVVTAFHADFMEYVQKRQQQLYIPPGRRGVVTASKAYCWKEEFYNDRKFNWAEERAGRVKKKIRRAIAREEELSPDAKVILSAYLSRAFKLSLPRKVPGVVKLRRSSRNSPRGDQQGARKDPAGDASSAESSGTFMEPEKGHIKRSLKAELDAAESAQVRRAREELKQTVVKCLDAMTAAVRGIAEMNHRNRSLIIAESNRWKKAKREFREQMAFMATKTDT